MSKHTEQKNAKNANKPLKYPIKKQILPIFKSSPYTYNQSPSRIQSISYIYENRNGRSVNRSQSRASLSKRKPNSRGSRSYSELPEHHRKSDSKVKSMLRNLSANTNSFKKASKIHKALAETAPDEPILSLIKKSYEECFSYIQNTVISTLKEQSTDLNKQSEDLRSENKKLHSEINRLARENYELSKIMDEKEEEFSELNDKVLKISNLNPEQLPEDTFSWQYVVTENKTYYDYCIKLKQDLTSQEKKEKKLIELLSVLKQKTHFVDETPLASVLPSDTDNELIVSLSARDVPKPAEIPQLDFSKVEVESSSSSDDFISN